MIFPEKLSRISLCTNYGIPTEPSVTIAIVYVAKGKLRFECCVASVVARALALLQIESCRRKQLDQY